MRRAIFAAAGTAVGLVALLDYRSHGVIGRSSATGRPVSSASSAPASAAPSSTAASPAPSSAPRAAASYTGTDVQYAYGDIQVRITVAGGKIRAVTIPAESATDPRSASINAQAVPILTREALAAQSLRFDAVSGATFTSDAFAQSLQAAIDHEGK